MCTTRQCCTIVMTMHKRTRLQGQFPQPLRLWLHLERDTAGASRYGAIGAALRGAAPRGAVDAA